MKINSLFATLALCTLLAFGVVPCRASEASEQPLRQSVERLERSWNSGDGALWAAEYWPEGELINILGGIMPNAASVRDRTNEILAGPFKGTRFASTVRRIVFLGDDIAIVDTDIRVSGLHALPPGAVATSPGTLDTRMKHVYQRRAGIWRIVASQNTAVAPVGAPHPK